MSKKNNKGVIGMSKLTPLSSLLKSCIITALAFITLGMSTAYAYDDAPLPPRASVGTTVVLVPDHYRYYHHHRVFVPAHYVKFMCGCYHHRMMMWYGCRYHGCCFTYHRWHHRHHHRWYCMHHRCK